MMRSDLSSSLSASEPKLSIPQSGQPSGKPIFDADEPVFTPNTVTNIAPQARTMVSPQQQMMNQAPAPQATTAPTAQMPTIDSLIAKSQSKKRSMMFVFVGAGLLVLAVAGYFLAPMLLKTKTPVVVENAESPVRPIEPTQPATPQEPETAFFSLFSVKPESRATAVIDGALTMEVLNKTLLDNTQKEGLTEIKIMTKAGASIAFSDAINVLAPSLAEKTASIFTPGMSIFTFSDKTGIWPGYVAKLKADSTPELIKDWFTEIEKTTAKANFFIVKPGTLSAFKNGLINNVIPDRYAPGTTAGASFSYLIIPDQKIVVVSTSFAGIKEAVRLLGL
jgi:hypothetical protein